MEYLSKDLIAASSIPIILTLLSKRESYGYEIIKTVKMLSDGKLTWKEGTLYPLLDRMESRGLVRSSWRDINEARRRKYFFLTDKGKEELEKEMVEWQLIFKTIIKANDWLDLIS